MENYTLALTVKEIKEYIGGSKIVAFDYETAPDDPWRNEDRAALDPHKSHIVGCSFSVSAGTGIYVPVAHTNGKNINSEEFYAFLNDLLTDGELTKVAHNLAFEAAFSYARGIVIQPPVYDTICASQLCLNGPFRFRTLGESGLKTLAGEICGTPLPTYEQVAGGRHFDELDPEDYETVRYGAADSDYSLRLREIFNNWFEAFLPRHRYITEEVESPAAVYIGLMKYNGIPIDSELLEKKRAEAEKEVAFYYETLSALNGVTEVGESCSTRSFRDFIYKTLNLPVLKRTETGAPSLDDASLILLKDWCAEHRPECVRVFELVQRYRRWGKLKSTYLDGYKKYINLATGRIHPDILGLSTETGRMCCRNPNMQNMPRKANDPAGIRGLVRAPEGMLLVSCDFSQIELRIGAFYCRDRQMLKVYREDGDIHAATTSVIFPVTYEEARDKSAPDYKEHRTIAKNVNFGIFYGLYAKGLQSTLKFKAGLDKPLAECMEILNNLRRGYPGLAVWQDSTKREAACRGYTETWLGRRRYLPDINSGDWGKKSFAERCALNTPVQGTAADIIKLACASLLPMLRDNPWLQPILQIHDELTFLVPEDKLEDAVEIIKLCMERQPFPELDVPLKAEAAAGENFSAMEEL